MSDSQNGDDDIYNEDYAYEEEDLGNKIVSNEIDFLDEHQIMKEREKVIEEAKEKLFLERDDAILAMIYLQWKVDKLDNWYDNVDENKIKAGIELSEKKKKELIKDGIESNGLNCLICFEDKNDTFFSLSCGHQFCSGCWTEYLKEKIKTPLSALLAKCPQNGCTCVVYEKIYRKFLDDKKSLEKLDKAIYKNFINRNDDIRQCPNEHCHFYVKSTSHSFSQEIHCPCGTTYGFKCLKEPHRPCSCELVDKFTSIKRNTNNEEDDNRWIMANTKECPHCHQKIQKSQGCNYMLCDPKAGGCGHAFCYVCETDWSKHANDHFNCNKYTDAIKKKEENAKRIQKELDADIRKYERYDFYYPRYMNFKNAVEICETKFRDDLKEKIGILNAMQNLQMIDTKFIFDALDAVTSAKRTLKYSYIFGYYMKDTEQKELFEHSQGILEYNTEGLHQAILESNLDFYIELERDDFKLYFAQYKENISQKTNIILNYRKSLLEEIENKFIDDLDNYIIDLKL